MSTPLTAAERADILAFVVRLRDAENDPADPVSPEIVAFIEVLAARYEATLVAAEAETARLRDALADVLHPLVTIDTRDFQRRDPFRALTELPDDFLVVNDMRATITAGQVRAARALLAGG